MLTFLYLKKMDKRDIDIELFTSLISLDICGVGITVCLGILIILIKLS